MVVLWELCDEWSCIETTRRSLYRGKEQDSMADTELFVCSAKLDGFPPFPTWNGTIAAPEKDTRGFCSVLGADGELVVLQKSRNDDPNSSFRILKVLPSAEEESSSFCQCWTNDGAVVASARGRCAIFYSSDGFKVVARLRLHYSVTSMDITKRRRTAASSGDDAELLLIVGTAFGALLYNLFLDHGGEGWGGSGGAENETPEQELTPLASVHDGIAVCFVKFSSDGRFAALGTMDGRLFLRRLDSHMDDVLATFGTSVLSRVLSAPRITSMSFSGCSTKLVVATRKGNVYVYGHSSETGQWQALPSCKHLSANPNRQAGGAAVVSKAATAAQTLVTCWGPVFVVCSRAVTSRLEMYDFASGCLLHSLQLAPASAPAAALNQCVVTGICTATLGGRSSRLLCHDTSANVAVVEWPFLDAIARR